MTKLLNPMLDVAGSSRSNRSKRSSRAKNKVFACSRPSGKTQSVYPIAKCWAASGSAQPWYC